MNPWRNPCHIVDWPLHELLCGCDTNVEKNFMLAEVPTKQIQFSSRLCFVLRLLCSNGCVPLGLFGYVH